MSDGDKSDTGTVGITVNAVNDAPVADDNAITVAEDSTGTSLGLSAPAHAENATLWVTGEDPEDSSKMRGTIEMTLEDGAWKLIAEKWKIGGE